jgi:hypothetical protein
VPIAVKDLCWTKDAPTAAGMNIYRDNRPSEDATVVTRFKEAGAVILGKLQLTEGAYADHHPDIDPPRNPWDAMLWSGASSSGSGVATAAGLCYGSLGSDTGGSIRFPSAANGVTGLKPTWGRVSRYGVEVHAAVDDIDIGQPPDPVPQHEQTGGCVVGERVDDADVPIRDARSHDLDGGDDVFGCPQDVTHLSQLPGEFADCSSIK